LVEVTARGAAFLAGLAADVWESVNDLSRYKSEAEVFTPKMSPDNVTKLLTGWRIALRKTIFH
jgi:glycerol kinase